MGWWWGKGGVVGKCGSWWKSVGCMVDVSQGVCKVVLGFFIVVSNFRLQVSIY